MFECWGMKLLFLVFKWQPRTIATTTVTAKIAIPLTTPAEMNTIEGWSVGAISEASESIFKSGSLK